MTTSDHDEWWDREDEARLTRIRDQVTRGGYDGLDVAQNDVMWLVARVTTLATDLRRANEGTRMNETERLRRERDDAQRATVYAEDRVRDLEDELRELRTYVARYAERLREARAKNRALLVENVDLRSVQGELRRNLAELTRYEHERRWETSEPGERRRKDDDRERE
jgi:chromosome segregation ATPase